MKTQKKLLLPACILLALSLILTIGVLTVFRPCAAKEDGSWMNCHYAAQYVMAAGLALCVLSLLHLIPRISRILLDVLQLALSVLVLLIPGTLVHLCMMDSMRCNAVTHPAVSVFAALIAV